MSDLRFTLLPDGPSDRALLPILAWLLRQLTPNRAIQSEWADLRRLRDTPRTLPERILRALELYPCELLFVHRDAESLNIESRVNEINDAVRETGLDTSEVPTVCVVPVRMQEAWLLFNQGAIRSAAGNPNGREVLTLPQFRRLESLPDPKDVLHNLLRSASGLTGRRLSRFPVSKHAPQVSSFINDFHPLRQLPAFSALEREVTRVVRTKGWNT